MTAKIPTANDVVDYLNERLAARGVAHRVEQVVVLQYMNPMWLANWDSPELAAFLPPDVSEEELREARWRFPQVREEWWPEA
jgi:hypothetical protein